MTKWLGAEANGSQGDGLTALHWAAEHGDHGLASLLLQAGANPAAVTRLGRHAPIHVAARGGNELIRYLVSKGADATAVSRSGQTTVDMANGPVQRVQPFPDTIARLESPGARNNHRWVSC